MTGPSPVRGPDTEMLVRMIEAHVRREEPPGTHVARLDRRPSPYGSTAWLEEIDVRLADGRELRLMFKDLRPSAVLAAARQVRPAALCDAAREPLVYEHLLGPARVGAARCLSAAANRETGDFHVLLERVEGLQLCHVGSGEVWHEAARWLARLHTGLQGAALGAVAAKTVPLLIYDDAFHRDWLGRAVDAVLGREGDRERRRAFERLAARHDAILAVLAEQPVTFLHGECYASNLIVRDEPLEGRVCPVDWETSAIGPAAFDVAALTSGDWPPDARRRLVAAYLDELRRLGEAPPPIGDFEAVVGCCRLQLAIQLLAWRREWAPPREHARDWLAEALALEASVT
jgi:Ser/Thr protein kinase RdoA (MazF antagonist)